MSISLLGFLVLNEVAAQLQAIMCPNLRKARPTCKKDAVGKVKPPQPDTEGWEVSDGELTASGGPNVRYRYI